MTTCICSHVLASIPKEQPVSPHQQLRTILQKQGSLQYKYLVPQDPRDAFLHRLHFFLSSYICAMNQRHLAAGMQRTSHGSTGFTFMCTTPSDLITHEKENTVVRFVLKWQNDVQNKIEILGARFFRFLGFKPPVPIPLKEALDSLPKKTISTPNSQLIHQLTKAAGQKAFAMTHESSPIIMPALHGVSLDDLIESADIFLLSKKDQISLFKEMGVIAFGDLLIGNDDRTFSFHLDRSMHNVPVKFNSGNLLVAVETLGHDPKKGKILRFKAVYPIDNCPSTRLVQKITEPLSDDIDLGCSFLCTEIDKKENSAATISQSSEYEPPSESSSEYQTKAEKVFCQLHSTFLYFKDNLPFLAKRIFQGLSSALPHDYNPDLFVSPLQAQKALTTGLKIGMERAKSKKWQSLRPDLDFSSDEMRAYALFVRNLSSLSTK